MQLRIVSIGLSFNGALFLFALMIGSVDVKAGDIFPLVWRLDQSREHLLVTNYGKSAITAMLIKTEATKAGRQKLVQYGFFDSKMTLGFDTPVAKGEMRAVSVPTVNGKDVRWKTSLDAVIF